MLNGRTTLSKFLIEQLKGSADASDLAALLVDVAAAIKAISAMAANALMKPPSRLASNPDHRGTAAPRR